MNLKCLAYLLIFFFCLFNSCEKDNNIYSVSLTNQLNIERVSETIEIEINQISSYLDEKSSHLTVIDNNGKQISSQLIDIDKDAINDYLIFQTNFEPNETKKFKIKLKDGAIEDESTSTSLRTFCRIVPERMDDFAWENDKVAFRTYGPKCQQLFENGDSSGLISSGIDCWTKRVAYPIIDKWYDNYQKGISYHVDHGEGLDAYHVGTTRGCGGIAFIDDKKKVLSQNFISWKILANGPIRSIFELKYAPISIDSVEVTETKQISIDLGSNLYYCKVSYESQKNLSNTAIGIALHSGKGKITSNENQGWLSYWEPYGDSNLGTGVLISPKDIIDMKLDNEINIDESLNNIWLSSKVVNQTVSYWSGFGWQKAGDFESAEDWEQYLSQQSKQKNSPIKINITEK